MSNHEPTAQPDLIIEAYGTVTPPPDQPEPDAGDDVDNTEQEES